MISTRRYDLNEQVENEIQDKFGWTEQLDLQHAKDGEHK